MSRNLSLILSALVLVLVCTTGAFAEETAGIENAVSNASGPNILTRIIGSGPIAWVLCLVSVIGLSLGIQRLMTIKEDILLPPGLADDMHSIFGEGTDEEALDEALGIVQDDDSMMGQILFAALDKKDFGYEAMRESADMIGGVQHNNLMAQVNVISLLASVGPMLGLLGTVWGMIGAFFEMASAGGSVDPSMLSDSIGGAMITTAMGLIIAIPMMTLFFFLRNRVNKCVLEASTQTTEVLDYFRNA